MSWRWSSARCGPTTSGSPTISSACARAGWPSLVARWPRARFHAMVREQLGAQTNWEDSDDLAMLFQGTYKSPFYRKLHRLLHDDLDLHRAIADCKLQIADFDEQQSTIYNLQSAMDELN